MKGNAYGHGSVSVSLFLEEHGITCFAVGKASEGKELRQAGVTRDIIVLSRTVLTLTKILYLISYFEH